MTEIRTGDLVLHIPSDGSRGSGPYYVDHEDYGGDVSRAAVASLVPVPFGWTLGYPRNELEVVGHFIVPPSERRGNAFTVQVLHLMHSVIKAGRQRFYQHYPTFENGKAQMLLSEMTLGGSRSGFITDGVATGVDKDSWDYPGSVQNQMVYAVPRDGAWTYVEVTAQRGKFLLHGPDDDRSHFVVIGG